MQASETKLQEIIEGTKQYVIPLFQRSYSWEKSHWELLWEDIIELYYSDNLYPHFMGSIVTMQTESLPEGVTKFLLIDGQQRLTTIFILLAVLRDKATSLDSLQLAAEINDRFLVNAYSKESDYFKLNPTQVDRKSFYNIVKRESNIDKNINNINDCYLFFEKKIKQRKDLEIQKIKNIICNSLIVVRILLGKDDNPYLVFESLNAKGKPLTQADLIRNYFFMQINGDEQDLIYRQYWLPMQRLLGENLTDFIRHYLTKNGVIINQNEIYFYLKNKVNRAQTLSYLKDLFRFSKYYAIILNPNLEENLLIRKYLYRLKRLDIKTVYPFILNCYHGWKTNFINEEELINIFKIIENYLLRRFICNVQTRGLNRIFATLYSQIRKEINLSSRTFLQQLKLSLQNQNYPQDDDFKTRLMEVKLYGGNRSEKAKLILESLEESFEHKEKVSFDNLTIEHIMPQTLSDWWKNYLGEDSDITYNLLIHSLGNLTLTAYNSELSNDTFINKQKALKESHLELNKYFTTVNYWQREDIEKRARLLVEKCLKIWSYFGDKSQPVLIKSNVTGTIPKILRIFGEEYSVKSWRDVLETTLNILADSEPEKFKEIMEQFPRFLAWDEKDLRCNRQLKNGAFVEVQLSSKDIYSFCQKAMETADLSSEDWIVETIDLS
ncbi:DUF262 domain-containing protein [Geminocystis sp.]|uniref:DUF262 domain-containing protein n=1 Tax=Geminocystis sp. TaxID=2664100 RepID=UPI003593AA38